MSVSIRHKRRRSTAGTHEPPLAKVFLWTVSLLTAMAAPGALRLAGNDAELLQLALWAAIVAAVDLGSGSRVGFRERQHVLSCDLGGRNDLSLQPKRH